MNLRSRFTAAVILFHVGVVCHAQALPTIDLSMLSQQLELGPLRLTFGPQDGAISFRIPLTASRGPR